MRRRRKRLEVSTFPFLAVLLCAMGSLILVLLVMDRRAKLAARLKAQQAVARAAEDAKQAEAERREAERAGRERREQIAKAAWEEKRAALHTKLVSEQTALQLQMRQLREKMAEAAARLRAEEEQSGELRRQVARGREQAAGAEQALAAAKAQAATTEQRTEQERAALARMTNDLTVLERALRDLKETREREKQTYSIVPYRGKRGESRRPIYVECAAGTVVFHPEKQPLSPLVRRAAVRAEVERRIALQQAKLAAAKAPADQTPYLMLLVRPSGIETYFAFQAALRGLDVRFGYELIDDDWVLDFPADDEQPLTQPWSPLVKHADPPTTSVADASSPPVAVKGYGGARDGGGFGDGGDRHGAGAGDPPLPGNFGSPGGGNTGVPGASGGPAFPPGNSERGGSLSPVGGRPSPGGSTVASALGMKGTSPDGGGWGGGGNANASGAGEGPPPSGVSAQPGGGSARPNGGGTPYSPSDGRPRTDGSSGNSSAVSGDPVGTDSAAPRGRIDPTIPELPGASLPRPGTGRPDVDPSLPPLPSTPFPPSGTHVAAAPGKGPPPGGPVSPGGGAASASPGGEGGEPLAQGSPVRGGAGTGAATNAGGAGGQGEPDPIARFAPKPPVPAAEPKRPPPLRAARLSGDRDYLIFIECQSDAVVLYPSRQQFPLASLAQGPKNPLTLAVRQMIDRRQSAVRPGEEPYRPQVRFLVRPETLRTYHLVYPLLDALPATKTRQNLAPEDDVRAIIAGF